MGACQGRAAPSYLRPNVCVCAVRLEALAAQQRHRGRNNRRAAADDDAPRAVQRCRQRAASHVSARGEETRHPAGRATPRRRTQLARDLKADARAAAGDQRNLGRGASAAAAQVNARAGAWKCALSMRVPFP